MEEKYIEILNKPEFDVLSQEQKNILSEFMTKIQGKSGMEKMNVVMEYSRKLPKGETLTKDEKSALISAFYENMSESEKKQIEPIFKLFKY